MKQRLLYNSLTTSHRTQMDKKQHAYLKQTKRLYPYTQCISTQPLVFLTAFDLHRLLAEELYFNTLVLIIRSLVHLSQDNCHYLQRCTAVHLYGARSYLELFDYNCNAIILRLLYNCFYSVFTFNSNYNYTCLLYTSPSPRD